MVRVSISLAIVLACVLATAFGAAKAQAADEGAETNTTTTTSTSTTTTTKPTTTSTTTKPTTTTTTPTTTIATTTTTTTAKTTPAPAPPAPSEEKFPKNVHEWYVEDKNNKTCLAVKAAFEITYEYKDEKNQTQHQDLAVPKTESSGSCGDKSVTLNVVWQDNSLALTFSQNTTSKKYSLNSISVTYVDVRNETRNVQYNDPPLFETPVNQSYKCMKDTTVALDKETNLRVANLQVGAFTASPKEFSSAFECAADDVSPVVPLAVGISLALLVVIVLIAYLIGRSRSRARGYQSV